MSLLQLRAGPPLARDAIRDPQQALATDGVGHHTLTE